MRSTPKTAHRRLATVSWCSYSVSFIQICMTGLVSGNMCTEDG